RPLRTPMELHRRFLHALGSLLLLWNMPSLAWTQELDQRQALNFSESRRPDLGMTRTGARRTNVVAAVERVRGAVVNIHSERNLPGTDLYGLSSSANRVN